MKHFLLISYIVLFRAWKDLSVNEKYSYYERSKLAVWEDPVPSMRNDVREA